MNPFQYPDQKHVRRHGPRYVNVASYREWIRDEFSFRCTYCLDREMWNRRAGRFHVDHCRPQSSHPLESLDYDNLIYACSACNLIKGSLLVPDPCESALGECLRVDDDGVAHSLSEDGLRLIEVLNLNDADCVKYRRLVRATVEQAVRHEDQTILLQWMGYPDDLPDLSLLEPLENRRPDGVNLSFFARRQRGELSLMY